MARRLNSSGNVVTVFKRKWWSQTALKEARDNWSESIFRHMSFGEFWDTVKQKSSE